MKPQAFKERGYLRERRRPRLWARCFSGVRGYDKFQVAKNPAWSRRRNRRPQARAPAFPAETPEDITRRRKDRTEM